MDNNSYFDDYLNNEEFADIHLDKPAKKPANETEAALRHAILNILQMHPGINSNYLDMLMDPIRRDILRKSRLTLATWIPCGETISAKGKAYPRGGFFSGQYITLKAPRNRNTLVSYNVYRDKKIFGPVVDPWLKANNDQDESETADLPFSTFIEMPDYLRRDLLAYLACEKEITDLHPSLVGYILSGFQIRLFNQIALSPPSKIKAASSEVTGILDRLVEFHKQFQPRAEENPNNQNLEDLLRTINKMIAFIIEYFKLQISPTQLGIEIKNNRLWRLDVLKRILPEDPELSRLPDETLEELIDLYEIKWAKDEKISQMVRKILFNILRNDVLPMIPSWDLKDHQTFEFPHCISKYISSEDINDYCSVKINLDIDLLQIDDHIEGVVRILEHDFKPYQDIGNPLLKPLGLPPYIRRTKEETETIRKIIFGDAKGDYISISLTDLLNTFDLPHYYSPNDSLWFMAESLLPNAQMTLAPLPDYDNVKIDFDTPIIITRTDEDLSKNLSNTPNVKARTIARVVGLMLYGTSFGDYEMGVAEEFLATSRVSRRNMVHWKAMLRFYPLKKSSLVAALKTSIKEKFKAPAEAQQFRDFVVRLVWNGKEVDNKRLKMAEKLFDVLGLDTASIHGDLHRLITSGATSKAMKGGAKKFSLDKKALQQIEESTREVQDKLQEIFDQEDPKEKKTTRNKKKPKVVNVSEPGYMQILRKLIEREEWSRAEVEEICKKHGMLLNTALEAINDYTYEKYDDALVEDNDEVINVYPEIMQ